MTEPTATPPVPARARAAERALLGLVLAAAALRVLVASGAATRPLLWAAVALAAAAAMAAALLGSRRIDGFRAILIAWVLLDLPQVYPRLGGDGFEYFGVARSLLLDRDLDLANDYAGLGARPVISPLGEVTARTPLGLSLLWMPVIAVVHVMVKLSSLLGPAPAADGFSPPYLAAVTTASFLFGATALLLVETLLRRLYGRAVALLAAAALWLATPLMFYSVANPFMSHAASALACAAFVLAWWHWRERAAARPWLVLGALGALMALVRVQDAALMALPAYDLLRGWRRPGQARRLLAFAAGPLLAAALQSVVWARLWSADFARIITTQGPGFRARPEVLGVLLSPWHGLFTFTPLYLLAVLGWLLWLRRDARVALLCFAVLGTAVAVNAAMGDWWGSESFGQRRLLGLTPLFALGLGEGIAFARRRPLLPVAAVLALLALWNHQLAATYNAELAGPRGGALHLDRVLAAQGEMFDRQLVRWQRVLPRGVWAVLYDHLRGTWLDEGPRSFGGRLDLGGEEPADLAPVLAHNWARPEAEGDVAFRRTKERSARLRVPIRTAAGRVVIVRARSEVGVEPQRMALVVNGHRTGEAALPPSWTELRFDVPGALLRPGFNDVELVFTAAERELGARRRDVSAAVDWIVFERSGS
ncbi:MAG TPA: hypothetical protein VFO85_01315 [Vicinamibacteria bacterium]|nr:hypothetical protein [Vicinamibacteria bacterium]